MRKGSSAMFTLACHAITEYRMDGTGRTRLIENSKHFMTNNINQQKFIVLLKYPEYHENDPQTDLLFLQRC